MFAEIVINRPVKQLNKALTYEIPAHIESLSIGTRVLVPLGRSREEGIVVGVRETVEACSFAIKPIYSVLDKEPWFTDEMIETAKKLSTYYLCSFSEALSLFTIDKQKEKTYERPKEKWLSITDTDLINSIEPRKKRQRELAEYIVAHKRVAVRQLQAAGFSLPVIKQVMTYPFVVTDDVLCETKTKFQSVEDIVDIPLTDDQQACYHPIHSAVINKETNTFLLHGVTGSGKTQIYLKAVQQCIAENRIAIVLVPEIILTNQIVQRFVKAFGDEVVVFHSRLTKNERYNNWERLRRKDSHVIIGARSAVFAPTDDIGIIILDEEHEGSYKQEDMVRYHAREVAKWRSEAHQCPVVLGSATPSMESYYKAQNNEYTLLELKHRIFNQAMPEVQVVDMKEELFFGNYSVFSGALTNLVKEVLAMKKQMIILLNRRGYSTFVMCRDCGEVIKCPHCDVAMVYHQTDSQLRCHYCEYHQDIPRVCPHCGSKKIKFFGTGTQKVEEFLHESFPSARVARLDQDVTSRKGRGEDVLNAFGRGDFDILLGTQMVAKGHDFPNVIGVGILTADSVLNIPLYTAAERTFTLLTQTAGRAGRGDISGKVVIQTYNPLHYAIIKSKTHDYLGFYEEEIKARQSLEYPPFGKLIHIVVQHKDKETLSTLANQLVEDLEKIAKTCDTQVFGPYEDGATKVRDLYRLSIMLRGRSLDEIKRYIYNSWIFIQEGILIDVDPI